MAMSNDEKLDTLMKEIETLVNILIKVDEGSEPMDTLTEQKQKVFDVLPVTSADSRDKGMGPIYKLLSCRPLTQMQIPLDVLEKLIASGFDLNSTVALEINETSETYIGGCDYHNWVEDTCLMLAVRNDHYDAARCLVQHGADCDIIYTVPEVCYIPCTNGVDVIEGYISTPIGELASKANAPLDLFDVLATPQNLRVKSGGPVHSRQLPLEIAVSRRHDDNALRLIQLGAPIGPASASLKRFYTDYNDELFTRLIPSDTLDIFKCVLMVLQDRSQYETEENDMHTQNKSKMLNRLFQYIPYADHMRFEVSSQGQYRYPPKLYHYICINGKRFTENAFVLQPLYWFSLLLANLGWSFKSTFQSLCPLPTGSAEEEIQFAKKIDDIWITYRDSRCCVISLQNLCIQQTRRSMRDFSEDSFISLPVPNKLRSLLMYQHVAEIACVAT